MYLPIVESSVPFDIDRPLTPEELEEVIRYCKNDVDATVKLYQARDEYIKSKRIVGEMYGVSEAEALGLTNAKLSARVLHAKHESRDDERDYHVPECLDQNLIPKEILDFFLQIRDLSIPATKLFGTGKQGSKGETLDVWLKTSGGECAVTYAWGGVHGAKYAFTAEATDSRLIVNYDVSSLYPNSMINFGYCSRSMEDPDAYKKLVETRLAAKKAGDKDKATALKLVVNTVYGAMLNQYNDLADRRAGRSVCITNQLAMTQLIAMLAKECESLDFININTDGIMFFIDRREDPKASRIVDRWCKITGFEMERDDFAKVYQKDVNNYIGIKTDGKMKTKGGYVSLYKGGDFKTNSLQIIHKAIVEYLVNGTPPEETIRSETDIFKFQSIVKTGGTYEGSYHYINGERVPIQKVNRVYAVKNSSYGQIVKGNGRPMLNPDPTDSAKLTLRCGTVVIPVKVVPNKAFASVGTKIPFVIGDLKAGIRKYDRQSMSLKASDVAVIGSFNAFAMNMTLIRAILRDDYKALDNDAYFYGYIDTAAAGE